jgi:hypothetical protein
MDFTMRFVVRFGSDLVTRLPVFYVMPVADWFFPSSGATSAPDNMGFPGNRLALSGKDLTLTHV